ncbi:MAG: xanthine dehydrogenase family protein molybdopterin-binding subunit [Haliscomenobacteraceae bacterium CHB4]|nr:Isoquinoline 1-oxidoreductase subunit beta [Saprospiraceae bacterium]MCE7922015.1 xanthine dehydrogenase family protein molybdopterin-binding subunit [Haliscomenobacteraceae bacterium CHB4]
MQSSSTYSRRDFLKNSALIGGGLFLGFDMLGSGRFDAAVANSAAGLEGAFDFNAYLSINSDGTATIFSPNPEVGQGVKTSFPMTVAEELDFDWKLVKVVQAPLDTVKFERQVAGGSQSTPHSWKRLRQAGATARRMLMEAAAKRWGVDVATCKTDKGVVRHPSGKQATYGELAAEAAKIAPPADVPLKDPKDFRIIGTFVRNVDNHDILTGKPIYGMDFYREGMLIAMIQHPPAFGMKLKSLDGAAAKAMPGIVDVVSFKNNVAVVGKTTWEVMKAREAVKAEYEKEADLESTADHDRIFKELMAGGETQVKRKDGDTAAAFAAAAKIVEAEFQCPFLSHAPMEPMNFFADVRGDRAELIGPVQTPQSARDQIAKLLNIPAENITLQLMRIGGGFGRRLRPDYALETAELSSIIKAPVKVIWTREDDMTGGIYRPAARYRFRAALDKAGNITGYELRGVGINAGNPVRENNFPAGAVPNVLIEAVDHKSPITTGPWRAPITNFLAGAEQTFFDEVAEAAGKDPVTMRLELFRQAQPPLNNEGKPTYDPQRFIKVIELAAEKSGWFKKRKKGVHLGFSVYYSHLTYVAQVAEVVKRKGKVSLQKVYCAVDCGIVVNKSGALNQVVGSIVDGLGHAMYGQLTFKDGEPEQKNFNTYRLIRINEIPEVEVYFVDNGIDPTGLGEPALPPLSGAVANALYKATGKRVRNQPFAAEGNGMEGIL